MIDFESPSPTQAPAGNPACSRLTRRPQAGSGCCSSTNSARNGESGRTSALRVSGASSYSTNPRAR